MEATPYDEMSDLALLQLCIWREARGEGIDGKRGVAHVIANRAQVACWWNKHIAGSLSRVILQPWQFSSFNANDPNADKWPADMDPSFSQCCAVAFSVMSGSDSDNTDGATYYYDVSIPFPKKWGDPANWENTLNVGRLKFWKPKPSSNHTEVQEAVTAEN